MESLSSSSSSFLTTSSSIANNSSHIDNLKDTAATDARAEQIKTTTDNANTTPTAPLANTSMSESSSSSTTSSSSLSYESSPMDSVSTHVVSSRVSDGGGSAALMRTESTTTASVSYSTDDSSPSRSTSTASATSTAPAAASISAPPTAASSSSAARATASSSSLPSSAPPLTTNKSTSSSSTSSNYKTALLRLMSDLKALENDTPEGVSASPQDSDNLFLWRACIFGPSDTAWEGGIFQLNLNFPKDYPQKPPAARFSSKIYHPNVFVDGTLCLDILQDHWSPVYTVSTILTSIQSLLTDPNPASPANPEAAKLYASDPKEYRKKVRACVAKCMSM